MSPPALVFGGLPRQQILPRRSTNPHSYLLLHRKHPCFLHDGSTHLSHPHDTRIVPTKSLESFRPRTSQENPSSWSQAGSNHPQLNDSSFLRIILRRCRRALLRYTNSPRFRRILKIFSPKFTRNDRVGNIGGLPQEECAVIVRCRRDFVQCHCKRDTLHSAGTVTKVHDGKMSVNTR